MSMSFMFPDWLAQPISELGATSCPFTFILVLVFVPV